MTDPTPAEALKAGKRGRHYEAQGDVVADSDANMTFRVIPLLGHVDAEQTAIAVAEALTGALQPPDNWREEFTRHSIDQLARAGLRSTPTPDAGEVRTYREGVADSARMRAEWSTMLSMRVDDLIRIRAPQRTVKAIREAANQVLNVEAAIRKLP